jgi:hypothetical protein
LNSDKIEKEQDYEARLKELEIKIHEKDDASAASVISWNNEKEVTFERQLGSLHICFFSLSKSCVIKTIHHGLLQKKYFCQDLCRNSVVYSILVPHECTLSGFANLVYNVITRHCFLNIIGNCKTSPVLQVNSEIGLLFSTLQNWSCFFKTKPPVLFFQSDS